MILETWLSIRFARGLYEVSSLGRVRSKDRYSPNRWGPILRKGKILRSSKDGCGYHQILIYVDGNRTSYKIHRLVAETFLGNKEGMQVNHKDCNKDNNALSNLEWVTHRENMIHAVANGRLHTEKRVFAAQKRRSFSDKEINEIKKLSESGETRTAIAHLFGVKQPTISNILLGKTYKTTSSVS